MVRDPFLKLAKKYSSPFKVQKFLKTLSYNKEKKGETLRSAQSALLNSEAHCIEATFIAAAILEKQGFPPLVVSIESKDYLDHVIFVFRSKKKWGSIALSRDRGLRGRPPIYRSLRNLVLSYFEPYIDNTGRITGYQIANLDDMGVDWRFATRNLWTAEKYLNQLSHFRIHSSNKRYLTLYNRFKKHGPPKPMSHWW